MANLFEPLRLGSLTLPNRVVMAPLTRTRAGAERVPNALMTEYYTQRAGAGLIISEATSVSPQGVGYEGTPGIWNEHQVAGWREITDSVHAAGGRIFLQLWHVGRISHPDLLGGELPVAPSAITPAGEVRALRPKRAYVTPRALETDEIPGIVEDFRRGAQNAKEAGFDGVEIHAANGYLIDQFLRDSTNARTDGYGGSAENRARFLLEVTDAVVSVWGANRVGVHLSPQGEDHDIRDSNPKEVFGFVAEQLAQRDLGFLFVREVEREDALLRHLKNTFGGPVIANDGRDLRASERLLASRAADAVAFGRDYIATPDLAERLEIGAELNAPRPETFYGEGPVGYTDYPRLGER